MYKLLFFLSSFLLALTIISCCDPKPRNSYPSVIDSSYSYLAVKDAFTLANGTVDSFYYPVYSLDITNSGSEADSIKLIIDPQNGYSPLTASQYIQPGETKTLKTYGPLPSNINDTAKPRYYGFVIKTADSLDLHILRPLVTITYGASIDGPESCGSTAIQKIVNVDSLRKK